jgi:predicted AAA+ superfamily ATPase
MNYQNRLVPKIDQSYFLFGPRGSGKSTWLKHAYPNATYLDLLDPVLFRDLSSRPERLEEIIANAPAQRPIIIDEIQKAPALLDVIHHSMEGRGRGKQFILTGSSARKLRRVGVNLLGGRLLWRQFHPYIASELGDSFDLRKAMRQGMLPLIHAAKSPEESLRAYVSLYIQQEVREEASVRDLGSFARFLEAISLSHGNQLNLNAVAADCSVTRKSAEGYVQVLEDMMLAYRLNVFEKRAKRLLAAHPKFFFFDAGVFQTLRPRNILDSDREVGGYALEGLVGQHLRAWLDGAGGKNSLYYWRTRAGLEVDFVVFGEMGFNAFEIKSGDKVDSGDVKGLKAFLSDYPEAQVALLTPSSRYERLDGIPCLNVTKFLSSIKLGRPLLPIKRG